MSSLRFEDGEATATFSIVRDRPADAFEITAKVANGTICVGPIDADEARVLASWLISNFGERYES